MSRPKRRLIPILIDVAVMPSAETIWPPELDAMTAAPDHHDVLFENDRVRVLDSRVPPGGSTPLHTHKWPGVLYVIGFSDFVRRDAAGEVLLDSRDSEQRPASGEAFWSDPLQPHSVTNVGDAEIRIISVEMKS